MTPRCVGRSPARRQRGAASLVVTLGLLFVMTLVAGAVHRNQVFEVRAAANQWRAAQASEAAEAGIEWTLAMLNGQRPLGSDCAAAASGGSFRDRFLAADAKSGRLTPRLSAGSGSARQAACVRQGTGWTCSCPGDALPSPPVAGTAMDGPAFAVQFADGAVPGTVRLLSVGCPVPAGDCLPGTGAPADAPVRIEVTLGLLPGLASLPAAALTARGDVRSDVPLGVHNTDPGSGGITVQAGGRVVAPALRVTTAGGASPAQSLIEGDGALQARDADRLFAATFGLAPAMWREQPAVETIACNGDCTAAVAHALGASAGTGPRRRLLWIEGRARLIGPLSIGTPAHPVVIVARAPLELVGGMQLHGLLYAGDVEWQAGGGPAPTVRGALVSEGGFRGAAAADLYRDAAVLARLQADVGSYARVPGSWKDF